MEQTKTKFLMSQNSKEILKPIKLRGHHLQQLYDYACAGDESLLEHPEYGVEFHSNKRTVLKTIVDNPDIQVIIVDSLDDMCGPCKKRPDEEKISLCMSRSYSEVDTEIAEFAGLRIGEPYSASHVLHKIQTAESFLMMMDYRTQQILGNV